MQHLNGLDNLYIWNSGDPMNLTELNYPAAIPFNRQAVTIMLRDVKNTWPDSIYHVFYDGEGHIDFGFDATILEAKEKNRMKIQVKLSQVLDNGVFMIINKTNPLNPIRNVRIIPDGYENSYLQMPFHPLFMERLKMFKTLRFMPWTKQDGVVTWQDRVTPLSYSLGAGVAYEHMIQLSNKLKTNAWISVPYAVSICFIKNIFFTSFENFFC